MRLLSDFCFFLTASSLLLASGFLSTRTLHAQASVTGSKNSAIATFATYSTVNTDRFANKNIGFTFGGDITGYLPRGFRASLEGRIKFAPGPNISENTYGGGLRIERPIQRLHPYLDLLIGYGTISSLNATNNKRKPDNSSVYSLGLGLDYDVSPQWTTRLDYQYEFWKTGTGVSFNPTALSFGVVYRIPVHPYKPH